MLTAEVAAVLTLLGLTAAPLVRAPLHPRHLLTALNILPWREKQRRRPGDPLVAERGVEGATLDDRNLNRFHCSPWRSSSANAWPNCEVRRVTNGVSGLVDIAPREMLPGLDEVELVSMVGLSPAQSPAGARQSR